VQYAAIGVFAGSVLCGVAQAQTRTDIANLSLEGLMRVSVTTATRTEEILANAPGRVEVVTADQIRRRGYRSLADVLKDLVDFRVDLGADPDYPANIAVQGTRGSDLVIVLLDGVRVSSPTNEPLPVLGNYPVHTAQQIEILYGPASATYGADAFAAVVNVITKKNADADGVAADVSFGQDGLYSQTMSYGRRFGRSGNVLVAAQFLSDRQPDLTRFYPDDYQGLQAQHTGVFNTIFGPMIARSAVPPRFESPLSARSFQTSLSSNGLSLLLFASQERASTSLPYGPDNGVYSADAFNENNLLVASLAYTRPVGRATSTSTISMGRHELAPESGYFNVFSNLARSYKYAYGSMLKADEQLTWKPVGPVTLSAGGTAERFFAIPQTADLNAPVRSQNEPGTILDTTLVDEFVKVRYGNTGAYGQVRYTATPAISVTVGGRADYNTRYGATFNPRVGVVLRPRPVTTVKLLYGSAFLAPSPYESFAHYGSFYSVDGGATYVSDFWHLGNPNLRPQRKRTVEATLTQGVGAWFLVSASAFHSRIIDMLQGTDPDQAGSGTYLGWPVAYIDFPTNEGDATSYGGTVGVEMTRRFGAANRVDFKVALSYADGHTTNEDAHQNEAGSARQVPLGAMVPLQLRSSLDLDWGLWSVAPRLTVVGPQRTLAFETRGDAMVRRTIDGYATVDVNVRRVLTGRLDGFVSVDNVFDARYRHVNMRAFTNPEELVGAPQNPRRAVAGLSIRVR
jgi:outer membrane cobalamin receptor